MSRPSWGDVIFIVLIALLAVQIWQNNHGAAMVAREAVSVEREAKAALEQAVRDLTACVEAK